MNDILTTKEDERKLQRTMTGGVVKLRATFVHVGILMHLWVILVSVEGWTYHTREQKMSWNNSREWCQKTYTDIVMVHNQNVTDFMKILLPNRSASPYYWIGIKKINRNWTWVANGQITNYTNWANNEPNNHNLDENCVEMYVRNLDNSGMWNDDNCRKEKYPVCQQAQCPNTTCTNNMVCEEQVNNSICVCKPGFFGPQCETASEKLPPSAQVCINSVPFENPSLNSSVVECFPHLWFGGGLLNCIEGPDNSSSVCTVQCPPAHLLLGFAEFTCRADGTWELYFPPMCASKEFELCTTGYVHFLMALLPSLVILLLCGCLLCCPNCKKTKHVVRTRTVQETENPVYEAEYPPPPEGPLCSA